MRVDIQQGILPFPANQAIKNRAGAEHGLQINASGVFNLREAFCQTPNNIMYNLSPNIAQSRANPAIIKLITEIFFEDFEF